MKLEIAITFDEFGWALLDEEARGEGLEVSRLLERACNKYGSEVVGGRAATVVPDFDKPASERETRSLTLELDPECLARLEREAKRQGVGLGRLCEHAALLHVADRNNPGSSRRFGRGAGFLTL
jgi:hypothetical protein